MLVMSPEIIPESAKVQFNLFCFPVLGDLGDIIAFPGTEIDGHHLIAPYDFNNTT